MNQPLDFVTHDLDLMMPGSQPMLTGGPMYNTGVYGSQQTGGPGVFGSSYGRPFWNWLILYVKLKFIIPIWFKYINIYTNL